MRLKQTNIQGLAAHGNVGAPILTVRPETPVYPNSSDFLIITKTEWGVTEKEQCPLDWNTDQIQVRFME